MAANIINTLQELVVGICDKLYAERQLITKNTVKNLVLLHGLWSEEELEAEVPTYINEWRISTLQGGPVVQHELQQQLQQYKQELAAAHTVIRQLNAELTSLRLDVIRNLRGLLYGQG